MAAAPIPDAGDEYSPYDRFHFVMQKNTEPQTNNRGWMIKLNNDDEQCDAPIDTRHQDNDETLYDRE